MLVQICGKNTLRKSNIKIRWLSTIDFMSAEENTTPISLGEKPSHPPREKQLQNASTETVHVGHPATSVPRPTEPRNSAGTQRRPYTRRPEGGVAVAGGTGHATGGKRFGTGGHRGRFQKRRRVLDMRKITIDYKRSDVLERFISKTGKILPRRVTGATPLVQRKIAREIKCARHVGLLPYSRR